MTTVTPPSSSSPPPASARSVLLTWTPAQTNTDGTAFIDPAGYRIDYGSTPSAKDQSVEIVNVGLTAHMIDNLPAGTSYFVIMSINQRGVVGPPSAVMSKTFN